MNFRTISPLLVSFGLKLILSEIKVNIKCISEIKVNIKWRLKLILSALVRLKLILSEIKVIFGEIIY